MRRICLVMIVRDEAHVLARCLASVRPYIDSYVICDTGSSDETCRVALAALAGVPGSIYHDQWVDFGHNRSLSLERARAYNADYLLLIDADEVLAVEDAFCFEDLAASSYLIRTVSGAFSYSQQRLLAASLPWRYAGTIHEYLVCEGQGVIEYLSGAHYSTPSDGARSLDPNKLDADVALLRSAVARDPRDGRMWFHLGLCERRAGRLDLAIQAFEARIGIEEGVDYEVWYADYMLGHCFHDQGKKDHAEHAMLEAYANFPQAIEPVFWLGKWALEGGDPFRALPLLDLAASKPLPRALFIREDQLYAWEARITLAKCLVALGRAEDANMVLLQLYRSGALPEGVLTQETLDNLALGAASKVA